MVTANEALQELEKWSLAPRQITAYLHITYGTGTKAATACQVTMRNIQFPTVILNSPRAILGGERLSILLRCTATDVCTFFFSIEISPLCLPALYGFAFRHVTTTNRSARNVPPSPNCLSIIPAEHIARVHVSSPATVIATILNSAPRWTGMKQFEGRIRAVSGWWKIMQYRHSILLLWLVFVGLQHDYRYLYDC